jgi:ethanolamine utilization protein EutN
MVLAKVVGNVVSTIKHPAYRNTKLALVQPVLPDGNPRGNPIVAVDTMNAGQGELVLVTREGNAASRMIGYDNAPIRSIIVGIVDAVEYDGDAR